MHYDFAIYLFIIIQIRVLYILTFAIWKNCIYTQSLMDDVLNEYETLLFLKCHKFSIKYINSYTKLRYIYSSTM